MRQATRLTKLEARAADLPGQRVYTPLEMATMRAKIGRRLEDIAAHPEDNAQAAAHLQEIMDVHKN